MPKRKPLIPFSWLPASWGLKGRSRAIAEAEYQFDGIELDRRLAEITCSDNSEQLFKVMAEIDYKYGIINKYELDTVLAKQAHAHDPNALARSLLEVDLAHNKITQYDYEQQLTALESTNEQQRQLNQLAVDLKHERINEQQYERKVADIKQEPWVAMPRISWDPVDNSKTFFEIDYNEHFIDHLRANGYQGDETQVVDAWINDVCSSVADEMNQAATADNFVTNVRRVKVSDESFTEHR